MKIGIVGHRGWIATALQKKLIDKGYQVLKVSKVIFEGTGIADFSEFDVVYLFTGKSRPTEGEMDGEKKLISAITCMPVHLQPKVFIYFGSTAVEKLSPYGVHKEWCERLLRSALKNMRIVRSPAVYGPGQDPTSSMLVPTIARGERDFIAPDAQTQFISVDAVTEYLVYLGEKKIWLTISEPAYYSISDAETLTASPRQLAALYDTWEKLRPPAQVAAVAATDGGKIDTHQMSKYKLPFDVAIRGLASARGGLAKTSAAAGRPDNWLSGILQTKGFMPSTLEALYSIFPELEAGVKAGTIMKPPKIKRPGAGRRKAKSVPAPSTDPTLDALGKLEAKFGRERTTQMLALLAAG